MFCCGVTSQGTIHPWILLINKGGCAQRNSATLNHQVSIPSNLTNRNAPTKPLVEKKQTQRTKAPNLQPVHRSMKVNLKVT